jgi:uncharacterized protein (DUF4213/DUF364 family)
MSVIPETIDIIKEKSPTPLEEIWIDDLVIGIFFTGVKLSTGHAGCAFTPIGEIPEAVCCPTTAARMPQAGALEGTPISEIIKYSLDPNIVKSAIGVATLNALSQLILESANGKEYEMIRDRDGFNLLGIQPHETVSLIGAFGPYINRLKTMGNPFFIIEKNSQTLRLDEMKHFKPESEMRDALEKSNVAILTGTSLVNHTIDQILTLLRNGIRAGIIGPTASMIPDAFFKRGIHVMAGIEIQKPDTMIKILKQGGSGYHLIKECGEKIAFVHPVRRSSTFQREGSHVA